MFDSTHHLPIARQARIVGISRGPVQCENEPVSDAHLRLMRRMGIPAPYRKSNTSKKTPDHTIWPYLRRTLSMTRSNHVRAKDIGYVPRARSSSAWPP